MPRRPPSCPPREGPGEGALGPQDLCRRANRRTAAPSACRASRAESVCVYFLRDARKSVYNEQDSNGIFGSARAAALAP